MEILRDFEKEEREREKILKEKCFEEKPEYNENFFDFMEKIFHDMYKNFI